MSTLEAILKGGGASRESKLYRWLVTWLDEKRVESFTDSCQLRNGVITAFFNTLLVVLLCLAILGAILFVIGHIVQDFARIGVEGDMAGFLASGLPTLILIAIWLGGACLAIRVEKRSRALSRAVWLLTILSTIATVVLASSHPFQELGIRLGSDLSLSYPRVFSTEVYENLGQRPAVAIALGWAVVILSIAVIAAIWAGIYLVLKLAWQVVNFFRTVVGRTGFWAWIRGRLCHPFEWID